MRHTGYRKLDYESFVLPDDLERRQWAWLKEGRRGLAELPTGSATGVRQLITVTIETMTTPDANADGAIVIDFPNLTPKNNDERQNYGN